MNKLKINNLISNSYMLFNQAVENEVFPGAIMAVSQGKIDNRRRIIKAWGWLDYQRKKVVREDTYYDLASLTKAIATTQAILVLLKSGRISSSTRVNEIFSQAKNSFLSEVRISDLLSHSAGFVPHQPYFLTLNKLEPRQRKEALLNLLISEKPEYARGSLSLYSDLGFMLLGLVIEKISGMEPAFFFKEKLAYPLGLAEKIFYLQTMPSRFGKDIFAPVEECPFRHRLLQGETSDENAYVLEGLAGHAGLYANIGGLLAICENILDQWQGKAEHPNYLASDLRQFLTRRNIPGSTWALGFDTPSKTGSSGGRYLAETSVGHLGFTGTSFWIDPTRDLIMILLSNRVHPSRENNRIKLFRPCFHDMVIESLGLI